ncbi:uncharacterized protein LOC143268427 [Peromyscus maniculatus bairdii]|uniref:uncharacterized protein LOC143268427 n=1 Tax=Peromyscus maniculatus bairdii TaxID=230844 RepID=UPI003FD31C18
MRSFCQKSPRLSYSVMAKENRVRIFSFYCRWANDLCKLTVGGNAMSHSKVKAGTFHRLEAANHQCGELTADLSRRKQSRTDLVFNSDSAFPCLYGELHLLIFIC